VQHYLYDPRRHHRNEAFAAIEVTLPLGTVGVEPNANEKGEREIWLDDGALNRLPTDFRVGSRSLGKFPCVVRIECSKASRIPVKLGRYTIKAVRVVINSIGRTLNAGRTGPCVCWRFTLFSQ
jgi:hypothetical protein